MEDIKNYSLKELKDLLQKAGFAGFCAEQVFGWVYQKRVEDFKLMTNLSQSLRRYLDKEFYLSRLKILKKEVSADGTQKFLFELSDKNTIEAVFIPEKERSTLCLSTQVGCKYKCSFCQSGKSGFKRNLAPAEIINQYIAVGNRQACSLPITASKITNIVFMGIGEPLDNFDNVVKSINIFAEPKGIAFSRRRISLSTCGLVPEIKKLADLKLGIKLSISLHSADDSERSKLMPINKIYPLKELIKAAKFFNQKEKYPITFEYALIRGYNTKKEDVHKLARLLKGLECKLNLIPLNCPSGQFKEPLAEETESFKQELKKTGLFFTLRKSRGQDIQAACGQLRANCGV